MADLNDLAAKLFGKERIEGGSSRIQRSGSSDRSYSTSSTSNVLQQTSTMQATALEDSHDGVVKVQLQNAITSNIDTSLTLNNSEYQENVVTLATTVKVSKGDTVMVTVYGNSALKNMVVTGVIGGGDAVYNHFTEEQSIAEDNFAGIIAQHAIDYDKMDSMSTDISNAQTAIDQNKKDIDEAMATANSKIETVQTDISTLKSNVEANYYTKTNVDDKTGEITKTMTADYGTLTTNINNVQTALDNYKTSNDSAVADAKKAGTDAQSALDSYKGTVSQTYVEKTTYEQGVGNLSSTMESHYTELTNYKTSNDAAVADAKKAGTDAAATVQSDLDDYKTSNNTAVADAKKAGTDAQSDLNSYKTSNDAAVEAAKKAGTDAAAAVQTDLDNFKNSVNTDITNAGVKTWTGKGVPTTSNEPASNWTTDDLKTAHTGDVYWDLNTGRTYRWNGTAWVYIEIADLSTALGDISSIKKDYVTNSTFEQSNTEIKASVSDSLTEAKTYTDNSIKTEASNRDSAITTAISTEVTNRNAAITTKANEIAQSVSETYTTQSTFTSYQTSNNEAVTKAQSTADAAQTNLDNYKTSNDSAVADAKSAGTTAQSQLSSYKTSNDAAVTKAQSTADTAQSNLDSYKTTNNTAVAEAKSEGTKAQTLLNEYKTSNNAAVTKAQSTADAAQTNLDNFKPSTTRTFQFHNAYNSSNTAVAAWYELGILTSAGDSSSVEIQVYTGNGWNSTTTQNSKFSIFIKDGYQSTLSTTNAFGVTVTQDRINYNSSIKVKVMASAYNVCTVWCYLPWTYAQGYYTLKGVYNSWTNGFDDSKYSLTEPTDGTEQKVSYVINASTDDVNTVQTNVNNVSNDLAEYKTTVTNTYATKAELKTTNDSISAEVSARKETDATVTNLSTNLSTNYSTTTQMNSAIEAKATSITTTVNESISTKTQQAIDNLEIGGRNLLRFTKTGENWIYSSFDKTDEAFIRSTTATSESFIQHPKANLELELGQTYTLSAYIKQNGYVSSCDMFCYNDDVSWTASKNIKPTTSYILYTWTFTVSSSAATPVNVIRFDNNGSTTSGTEAILYVKHPKLEKGSKATDWTVAPEDLDEQYADADEFASVSSSLQQQADNITATFTEQIKTNTDNIAATNSTLDAEIAERKAYMRAEMLNGSPALTLGASDSEAQTRLTNEQLQFLYSDEVVAYISRNYFDIMNGRIHNLLQIGGFAFVPRSNGNMSLKWIGTD